MTGQELIQLAADKRLHVKTHKHFWLRGALRQSSCAHLRDKETYQIVELIKRGLLVPLPTEMGWTLQPTETSNKLTGLLQAAYLAGWHANASSQRRPVTKPADYLPCVRSSFLHEW